MTIDPRRNRAPLSTERRRVLWLPLRDGKQQLLLSLEHPQALLDALRAR